MDLLAWVNKKLTDRGIKNYTIDARLVEIDPNSRVQFHQQNDIYFLANAFSGALVPINGEIIGFNEALPLTPAIMHTRCYKHQSFDGTIDIANYDTVNKMYVELLIATPRHGNH